MFRVAYPRLAVATVSLAAGLLVLAAQPQVAALRRADEAVFRFVSRAEGVIGSGTYEDPWARERFGEPEAVPPARVLALDDDPEGYFEAVPPPPADLAVVLARLEKRGVEAFGIGYLLQWEDPDVLAVEALRGVLDRYDGAVLGYPLKDSTVGEPVAAPFQMASVAYASVGGDATKLPVVNGIRGAAPELGGERTRGGFTRLETEQLEERRAYLLARWDDRVVFSLPLAVEIARRGLAEEDIRIEIGREIRLGVEGPRIPIDFRGRTRLPDGEPPVVEKPATAVISETLGEDFAPSDAPLYFVDRRLLGPKTETASSAQLPKVDAAVRGAEVRVAVEPVPRPNPLAELAGVVAVALGCGGLALDRRGGLRLGRLVVGWGGIGGVLAGLVRFGIAPLPLVFAALPAVALLTALVIRAGRAVQVVKSAPRPAPEPSPVAEKPKRKPRKKRRQ